MKNRKIKKSNKIINLFSIPEKQYSFRANVVNSFDIYSQETQIIHISTPINSDYFQIYGFENNKCHFKYVYYDCYAPIDITRKVAQNSRKGALDIINNGNFSTSANTPESKYNEAFFNNKAYCSNNH